MEQLERSLTRLTKPEKRASTPSSPSSASPSPEADADVMYAASVLIRTLLRPSVVASLWPDLVDVRVDSESAMRIYEEKEFVPRVPVWLARSVVEASGADGHPVVDRLWLRLDPDQVLQTDRISSNLPGAVEVSLKTNEEWVKEQVSAFLASRNAFRKRGSHKAE